MMSYLTQESRKITDFFSYIISAILAIFYDARIVLHAVLFLIVIDQVVGVVYALKKKEFEWKKFNKVFTKVILYIAAICAAFVYERYLLNSEAIYFTKIIAALVGAKEVSSSYLKFAELTSINLLKEIYNKAKCKL